MREGITVAEARQIIWESTPVLGLETLSVAAAHLRVLGQDVVSAEQ